METFTQLTAYPKYEINRLGVIRTIKNKRIHKPINKKGYICVRLSINSKKTQCSIHRLLAQTFIPNPNNLEFVDHKDRNKVNNDLSNLRWSNRIDNNNNRLFINDKPYLLFCKISNKFFVGLNSEVYSFDLRDKAIEKFISIT